MVAKVAQTYVPALRMKEGELTGLRDLAPDVADRVLPRLIVPPRGERDAAFQPPLLSTAVVPDIASPLASSWLGREVLVEATYLIDDLGREAIGSWLPPMFERAQVGGVLAIPLVSMADFTEQTREAFRQACGNGPIRLGIVIPYTELVVSGALHPLLSHLEAIGLSPADCNIIADFAGAEFGDPEIVAPIIGYALEVLQELGPWRQIVFQGTNYPERNPAEPEGMSIVARNEWLAWQRAVRFDPSTGDHMLFGDYAADCAKMAFGDGGGRAIRHYRYATSNSWIVHRGASTGSDTSAMRNVCRRIVGSEGFAGRSFSSADEFIFQTAAGAEGPGNAKIWRATNTTHHLTRVVTDIGRVRGFELRRRIVTDLREQANLFETI